MTHTHTPLPINRPVTSSQAIDNQPLAPQNPDVPNPGSQSRGSQNKTKDERIHLLQAMPFFGAISDNSVALILDLSETQQIASGEYFFHQDERGDSLYLLEEGRAVIFKESNNKEYILRYAEDGDCFGELALIDFTPRSASVRAEKDCTAIKIPATALHSLYQQDAEQFLIIQMNIGREVSRRLRASDERWFQLQINGSSAHSC